MPYNWKESPAGKQQQAINSLKKERAHFVTVMEFTREQGCSIQAIADATGLGVATVRKWLDNVS